MTTSFLDLGEYRAIARIDDSSEWEKAIRDATFGFTKVSLDIRKLKKIDKVFSAFGICSGEKIIAYCKDTMPLLPITMNGVIFTDKAFYYLAGEEPRKRAVQYVDLGKYLFTQSGKKGRVCAQSISGELNLFGGTLISENRAGAEVISILKFLQRSLIISDPAAKAEFENSVNELLAEIKNSLGLEKINERYDVILENLIFAEVGTLEEQFTDVATEIKAEFVFRSCDENKYKSFVESTNFGFSYSIPPQFLKNFIGDITDLSQEYTYRQLNELRKKIEKSSHEISEYSIIQAYLSIRMSDMDRINEHIDVVRSELLDSLAADELEYFRCIYGYHEMKRVYDAIQAPESWPFDGLRVRDGIGLTALHYAMILKKEETIAYLFKEKTWLDATPAPGGDELEKLYDYVMLSGGKQLHNREDILKQTHPETHDTAQRISSIEGSLKAAKLKLSVQETNLSLGRSQLSNLKRSGADYDKIDALEEKIEDLLGHIEENKDRIYELTETLKEEECALDEIMEQAWIEGLENLDSLRANASPLAQYLYQLFFDPEFFERVLSAVAAKDEINLYHYGDFYFVAPAFAHINLPICKIEDSPQKRSEESDKKKQSQDKPPYGTSWFSPAAHKDASVLKVEYHALAKTFHPDVSTHSNCEHIFQSISAEYEEIQSKLQ